MYRDGVPQGNYVDDIMVQGKNSSRDVALTSAVTAASASPICSWYAAEKACPRRPRPNAFDPDFIRLDHLLAKEPPVSWRRRVLQ